MRITEHIHALKIPFQIPIGPGKTLERFVYVYFILGPEVCLIDSGVKDTEKRIFDYLKRIGRQPEEISLLILTHAHPDHIGAAMSMRGAVGCTVAAHPEARAWIEDVELQFAQRPVPGFHTLVGGNTPVDRLLQDGERIDCGPVSLEVIHTPGHAAGSLAFYCKEEKVLFSGDAIPQKNDLPIYDEAIAVAASIARLKSIPAAHLLASWTDPLQGEAVAEMMEDGLAYLQLVHETVREVAEEYDPNDPMKLCARVVKKLGLPEVAVNPLIAKSLASHLPFIDRKNIGDASGP